MVRRSLFFCSPMLESLIILTQLGVTLLLRLLIVPFFVLLAALLTGLVKTVYWAWTRGRTDVVLLWVPPWRRKQFREVFDSSQQPQDPSRLAAEILPELFAAGMRGWLGVLRRCRYRPPSQDGRLCSATENPNYWLQQLFAYGASWMVFEQEYVPQGQQVRVRVIERENRDTRGTVSIGEVFGVRCELREPYDGPTYVPTVNVGDSLVVEVMEFRGRSALVRLVRSSDDSECGNPLGRPERRRFMVVASPWVYLELAPIQAHGTTVLRVEEIRLPGHKALPHSLRTLHRLVVRNGQRVKPHPLFLVGLDEPRAAVCGPLPPDYPTYPEWQRPQEFTVADAGKALWRTLRTLWSNRVTHARLWRQLRNRDVQVGPDCLVRLAVLEESRREAEPKQFWSFKIGPLCLHFKGSSPGGVVDFKVGTKTHLNARGNTYQWTDIWSVSEPTRVKNQTKAWWETHAVLSKWTRLSDRVFSWLLGYVNVVSFDGYARDLGDYVFVLEQRTVESSRDICLLHVTSEGPRDALLALRTPYPAEVRPGDAVRLFDDRQIPVAGGVLVRVQGCGLRVSVKWSRDNSRGIHYLMLDPLDIPARVQCEAIRQVRTDRSVNNYVSVNLRTCASWLSCIPALSNGKLSLWNPILNENPSVLRALHMALRPSGRVALVQGPPGTGKTTFIVELVQQLILGQKRKVLLVSQGNLAVDEALERIARTSERILAVRIGDRDRIAPSARHLHYDWTDPDTRNALRERLLSKGVATILRPWDPKAILQLAKDETISREEEAAERSEWERSAAHVDLVCATCVGIGTSRAYPFSDRTFDVVIVDEASRATQTETIVPLRLGRRWVLVGDHRQLPPTVLPELRESLTSASIDPARASVSLFELLQGCESPRAHANVIHSVRQQNRAMLTTQYRMHPAIARLVSEVFYGDSEGIVSAGDALGRGLPFAPFDAPICVIDTRGWPRHGEKPFARLPLNIENRSDRPETEKSLWNPLEVRLVVETVKALSEASQKAMPEMLSQISAKSGPDSGRITFAVITPYREQVFRLQEALGSVRDWGLLFLESDSVATVDSFQGKERDIVLFSAVRTARSGRADLRFLEDLRRLNVAFSRARHKLILIGDGATLEHADREILNEHGKKVFERFLDAFFRRRDQVQIVWPRPVDLAGHKPEKWPRAGHVGKRSTEWRE